MRKRTLQEQGQPTASEHMVAVVWDGSKCAWLRRQPGKPMGHFGRAVGYVEGV